MAIELILILLSLPISLLFLLRKHKKTFPPGPPGLPIIGNIHQYDTSNPPRYLWELSKKYGPLMYLRFGSLPTLIISSAKMAKEVMRTNDLQFSGRPNLTGQKAFSYKHIDVAFTPYKPANLSEIIMSLLCNLICRIAFSKRCEDDDGQAERVGNKTRFHHILAETQAMAGSFFFSDFFPFMGWVDTLTGKNRRLKKAFEDSDKFYQELVDEHLDPNRPKVDQQQEDIIDVLLRIRKNSETKIDLTLKHIKAVLMDVFVAGTDTSVATLVWSMTNLMRNPATMKKAQEEVRSVAKNKGFVDEDDLETLQYLKAVLKETFRLQPPVPLIPRSTAEECVVDGYKIEAKTLAYVNTLAIGRDSEVWDKPDEFIPERFMGTDCVDFQGQHFELLPFGSGRRICPGISMAMRTLELALANLLYKFDWKMPDGMKNEDLDYDILPGVAMHKKIPLKLMATKFI
ncbi:cytochrome P450 83B1 [Citrus sinensis]|nr:cytochrome P450 83B1 [Citrus sinensis]